MALLLLFSGWPSGPNGRGGETVDAKEDEWVHVGIEGQVGDLFANGWGELEAVTAESGGDDDIRRGGVAVDDEVIVRGAGVHADDAVEDPP